MAGSQLKRLKASLRSEGVLGPQKSKKEKKRESKSGVKRVDRRTALEGIRAQFNPFDLKHNVRGPKFDITSNRPTTNAIQGRPLEAKSASEQHRREILTGQEERKHKVGGIIDRRFGEDDPNMTPEERARERFRLGYKSSAFDLEDEGEEMTLTHGGQALPLSGPLVDDFDDDIEPGSDDDDEGTRAYLKRKALTEGDEGGDAAEQPERKKTRQEIYSEIIAKSKAHKHARQEAKEEDEDIRDELNKELPELRALLFNRNRDNKAETLDEKENAELDAARRKYDLLRNQLTADRRAQPTDRSKTEEEVAAEASARLKELEAKRIRRMEGQADSDSEDDKKRKKKGRAESEEEEDEDEEMEDEFGLGEGITAKASKTRPTATELGFDDEDDFLIEDDLVASGSELSLDKESGEEEDASDEEEEEDDEFTKGLLNEGESKDPAFSLKLDSAASASSTKGDADGVPYSFNSCPESHQQLLDTVKNIPVEKLPTVIVRLRTQYHAKLDAQNKTKLANLSVALLQHLPYLASQPKLAPFNTFEQIIRHIHSLAKTYPVEIGTSFRSHIEEVAKERPLDPNLGDLIVLTAAGTVFPPSDHFHQVVTPAQLLMARVLGQKVPRELSDLAKGVYLSILGLQYQQVSKRFMPEVMNFNLNTLLALAPQPKGGMPFPVHELPGQRVQNAQSVKVRKLNCYDCVENASSSTEQAGLRVAILDTTIRVLEAAADLWVSKPAVLETFGPFKLLLDHLATKACKAHLPDALNDHVRKAQLTMTRVLNLAQLARRPVQLHHHRPLAIKSNSKFPRDSWLLARASRRAVANSSCRSTQIRGWLRSHQTLRPGSRACRSRQAQSRIQEGAQGRHARAQEGCQLHGPGKAPSQKGKGRGLREEVQQTRGRDSGRGRARKERLRAGKASPTESQETGKVDGLLDAVFGVLAPWLLGWLDIGMVYLLPSPWHRALYPNMDIYPTPWCLHFVVGLLQKPRMMKPLITVF